MKAKLAYLGLVAFLFCMPVRPSLAQSSSSANDDALNAVATLLGINSVNSLPSCAPFTSKSKKFCPVIAQCPANKPLCISVPVKSKKKSTKSKLTCACSATLNASPLIGGRCEYSRIPGKCKITSITTPSNNENNCIKTPVKVEFKFAPTKSVKFIYPERNTSSITIADGKNPPQEWVNKNSIKVNKTFSCVKNEEISGACSPVVFEFASLDLTDASNYCW